MRLVVIRHAHAAPQAPNGSDAERRLTAEGERRFHATARALARLVPAPDILLTSPLVRAQQTAAIAGAAWGGLQSKPEPALAAGSVEAILSALDDHAAEATVALVGHEPTVSALVSRLVGAPSSAAVAFEPGASALLEVASLAERNARLVWFLPSAAALSDGVEPR